MKKIINLMVTSLKENIQVKRMLKSEIQRIDDVVNTLTEVVAEQQKNSFREAYFKLHKDYVDLEKESQSIISELTDGLKQAQRRIKKIEKELKNE